MLFGADRERIAPPWHTLKSCRICTPHLAAADQLDDQGAQPAQRRRDVAGYLYGVAGECALKHIMRQVWYRPTTRSRAS